MTPGSTHSPDGPTEAVPANTGPARRAAAGDPDLAAVFAALPGAAAVFAADAPHFTVLAASDALLAVAQRPREAIVGRPLADAFPNATANASSANTGDDGLTGLRDSLEATVRTGAPQRMARQRYDLERPDGSWEELYWDAVNTPVPGPDGAVRYVLHQTENVTARVASEAALARAERGAERILERVTDAHVTLDREFRFVTVNAAAERVLGMSRHEMLGRTHWEVFPASVDTDAGNAYRRVVAAGVEQHLTQHYVGEGYDLHLEIDAYPTDAGGVAVFWRDVTARLKAERENAYLAALVRAAGESMFGLTADGVVESWNPAAERLFGYAPDEIIGQSVARLAPPDRRAEQGEIFAAIRAGRTVSRETVRVAKDGRRVDVILTTGPVVDAFGRSVGISAVLVDITERKRVEAALRESEARLRAIYDGTYEYIGLLASDGTLLEANRASLEFAGSAREDVVGRPFWDTVWFAHTPGAPTAVRDAVARAAAGEFVRFESPIRRPSGEWMAFDISLHPVRDERGDVVLIVPEGREVTERMRAEAALEVERARLADVFRQAPVAVAVLRGRVAVDLVYELVNPRYVEMIPAGREPLGRRVRDVVPEMDDALLAVLQRVLDTGEPFTARDYRMPLDRDGDGALEEYFFNFVYHPLVEADGTVGGVVGVGTEVTESVRARRDAERLHQAAEAARVESEAARERAERLQALTAALARARTLDDVATVVVAEMVVALGARTGALAGRAPDGEALVLLRTVGFPEPVEAGVRRQALDLRSPLTECFRTQLPIWIESREGLDARYAPIAPVWDALGVEAAAFVPLIAAGETVGVISFAFERPRPFEPAVRAFLLALGQQAALAVERARLFDAEYAARAEAEAANRAKSEFLAVMSHELRTPLNAIGGYAELMEMGIRGPVSAQQREDLRRIQASQRHLLGLINEVLNYAKLETGTVHYDVADVRVRDALAGAEALVAPQAQAKALALSVAPCPPALTVRADAEKLRQILVNLLSNAVKFTDRGGRVELACEASGEWVHVVVRDTGIGIAADQLERIFEPFVQVRADLTRTAEGTGLGLAISRDLARGMGGDLTAESAPGAGSTFTLTLSRG